MRVRLSLPLLATALVAAGCSGLGKAPEPALVDLPPTPASWTGLDRSTATVEPRDRWWREFEAAALDELVRRVLENNHDLMAAAAQVDAAAAQARIAGAALTPQVAASFDPSRRRQNFIGLPIPGSGGVLSSTSTTIGANLNVSWEVDLWGRLRAGRNAAASELGAAAADLEGARLSLAGQASKVWFAAVEARQQLELARETLDNQQRTEDQIRRRFERGLRSALDLRLAISSRSSAEAAVAGRERQLDATLRQAAILAGDYPSAQQQLADDDLPALVTSPPAGLPSELVGRRPDLQAAELRFEAAGFTVAETRAALLPRLSLTGSAGRVSEDLEDLLDSDFSVWSLAGNLLQPIFQGGRLRAGVDLATARQRGAAEGYAQAVLRAFAEVETALAAEERLRSRAQALASAADAAEAAREIAQDRYTAGLVDYLSVLETQRLAFNVRSQMLEARRQLLDNRVDLHLALGGGSELGSAGQEVTAATIEPAAGLTSLVGEAGSER